MSYDYAARLISDNGDMAGNTVSNHFDSIYGRDWIPLQITGQSTIEDDYGYDSYGRMNSAAAHILAPQIAPNWRIVSCI
jgi:hypothetical protein